MIASSRPYHLKKKSCISCILNNGNLFYCVKQTLWTKLLKAWINLNVITCHKSNTKQNNCHVLICFYSKSEQVEQDTLYILFK